MQLRSGGLHEIESSYGILLRTKELFTLDEDETNSISIFQFKSMMKIEGLLVCTLSKNTQPEVSGKEQNPRN